jgi:hypothetical protein
MGPLMDNWKWYDARLARGAGKEVHGDSFECIVNLDIRVYIDRFSPQWFDILYLSRHAPQTRPKLCGYLRYRHI